jgi:hypothetical protein
MAESRRLTRKPASWLLTDWFNPSGIVDAASVDNFLNGTRWILPKLTCKP